MYSIGKVILIVVFYPTSAVNSLFEGGPLSDRSVPSPDGGDVIS